MVASSVVGPVVRSVVTSAINSGQGGLDPDALAYFAAVEAAGGSFDLSSIDGYDSNFSAGTDGWVAINGAVAGNIDSIGGRNDTLRFTPMAGTDLVGSRVRGPERTVGVTYELTADVYIPSANSGVAAVYFRALGNETKFEPARDTWTTVSASGVAFDIVHQISVSGGADTYAYTDVAGDDVVYIRNIRIRNVAFSAYTESYVKRAHSNLFFGLKRDGLWTKLTELYLLCGKTFGGLTVKAKGTGALTNVNFVTGDWVGAGSGCGLKGNGSTKYLDTSFNPSLTLSVDDCSLFAYNTQVSTTSNKQIFGSYIGTNSSFFIRSSQQGDSTDFSLTKHDGGNNGTRTGFTLGTRSSTNKTGYSNGSAIQILSSTGGAIPDLDIVVFGMNYVGYKGSYDGRLTVAGAGKGLTPPEAANLSTRVNAFMTSLGGNVY